LLQTLRAAAPLNGVIHHVVPQGDSLATVLDTYAHDFDAARREDDQRAQLAAVAASPAVAAPMAAPAGAKRTPRAAAGGPGTR